VKKWSTSLVAALAAMAALATLACTSSPEAVATGGTKAAGGSAKTGGTTGAGGGGTGGVVSTGGGPITGGRATTGGSGTGGASGGAPATGGIATGGMTGGAATGGATPTGGTGGPTCTPSCANRTCGSDGCNGTCGGCPPTQMCDATGTCQTPTGTGVFVDAAAQLTPISSDIYGVAFGQEDTDESYKVSTLDRWGGDAGGTYNWQKDLSNSGANWNCANYVGDGHATDTFVQTNRSRKLNTLMTIPITGWLANVATTTDNTYSADLGQNLSFCNYPKLSDGTLLPSATCCKALGTKESVLVDKGSNNLDTSFMGDWVAHFVSTFGSAANGGVKYYQLDNEPDNWQGLRGDIYPALYPPGTNCMDYSVKITSGNEAGVSPNDMINLMREECGIGTWGSGTPVYTIDHSYAMAMMAKGKQYEDANHKRIFDCLDTHYPGTAQEMWTNTFSHFRPWIQSTYPGTDICVSEYNVAKDTTDPTAAAQQADYLGTFGVMGVRLAAYWTTLTPKDSNGKHVPSYAYSAFAMFRNYDGAGAKFGSVSAGAASSYSGVHAYAATDSATNPTTLWVMLVNTATTAQSNVTLTVNHFAAGGTAKVFQSVNGAAPTTAPNAMVSGGKISGLALQPNSITLLVIGH
jgi:hypothetical protein